MQQSAPQPIGLSSTREPSAEDMISQAYINENTAWNAMTGNSGKHPFDYDYSDFKDQNAKGVAEGIRARAKLDKEIEKQGREFVNR